MPEPFKTLFNAERVAGIGAALAAAGPFDADRFVALATDGLDTLELKARSDRIADALDATLPPELHAFLAHLDAALHPDTNDDRDSQDAPQTAEGLRGWSLHPVGTVVARRGGADPEASLIFLRAMTQRFSAEFAVRPFLRDSPDIALAHAMAWTVDPNRHVRRLASEGTRPRLPWGIRLARFVDDPTPLLPILGALRDDPTEYVRRSVANNLNDIAKDHPDRVAALAVEWRKDAGLARSRLIRHACRTLIKRGHPATLAAFGFAPVAVTAVLRLAPDPLTLGETLQIAVDLSSEADTEQRLLLDLAVKFRKANGTLSPKVFKWTEATLPARGRATLAKALPLRPVTTRRHYPGAHAVTLLVNGVEAAEAAFDLRLPD